MTIPILDDTDFFQLFYERSTEGLSKALSITEPQVMELSVQDKDNDRTVTVHIFKGMPEEPHIFYIPAEFDTSADLQFLAEGFQQYGYTFAVMDCRGASSFQDFFNLAQKTFEIFQEWKQQDSRIGNTIVMGRSLGTAAALDLATVVQKKLLCLILESAFHTSKALLEGMNVDTSILGDVEDPFENKKKMSQIEKPVLFLHCHRDDIIPVQDIEWLVCESRSKASQFQIAGANSRQTLAVDADAVYFQTINNFINLRLGRRPKRKSWRERSQHRI